MKTLSISLSIAIIAIAPVSVMPLAAQTAGQTAAQTASQRAEVLYRQGQAAEKAGDADAARKAYLEALQANPNHAHARYSLGQLRVNAARIAATGREARFGNVMVPEFKLDGASLAEALSALQHIVEKESDGEVAPNFIIQDPSRAFADVKISLVLKKVPARAVLQYVMDQAGAKARHDEHAIVITPG